MWFDLLLIAILAICVVTDLKSRKIYNKVIFPSLAIAFMSHFVIGGRENFSSSFMGFLVGFGILLVPYLMGGIGAGDVKLLALIGALKGSSFVVYTSLYMAIIGGIIALLLLLKDKRLFLFLKSLPYVLGGAQYGVRVSMAEDGSLLTKTYPYGVAIAAGAVLTILLEGKVILW